MEEEREWTHYVRLALKSNILLPGLDLLTAARGRTLLMAYAAEALAYAMPGRSAQQALHGYSRAFLATHDRMAGLRWYSLPSTVREARKSGLQAVERAVLRTILLKCAVALEGYVQEQRAKREQPARPKPSAEKAN